VGHRVLGTLGLQAGSQAPVGLYFIDQFAYYHSNVVVDRNGRVAPLGLEADAVVSALGLSIALQLPRVPIFVNAAVSIPLVLIDASTRNPPLKVEPRGVGDLFVQPLKLGWRSGPAEVVAAYAFYPPTGNLDDEGTTGLGKGQWVQEFSLGGTVRFGPGGSFNASALSSFDIYGTKVGVDVRRGDSLQVQGGLGVTVLRVLDVGVAGYALWQVSDYSGSQLPATLVGARDRDFGLGPEIDMGFPSVRGRLVLRYTHDVAGATRPLGGLLTVGWSSGLWGGR
jgi:hypothetical protein